MTVRRARLGDEPILREIRLQALARAPDAFGSTYESEVTRTTADWQRWLSSCAIFILEDAAGAQGMVAGVRDEIHAGIVHLMAMWVNPVLRGSGGGDSLVAAVLSWAKAECATSVRLKVIQGNDRARRFYERNGFRCTGKEAIRERDGLIEIEMERSVVSA